MIDEKEAKIEDDAHHGRSDGRQRRREPEIALGGFDQGSADENEQKGRQESEGK